MQLSVIICCHNPRIDYLLRVLKALSEQTLLKERWELLLIDNDCTGHNVFGCGLLCHRAQSLGRSASRAETRSDWFSADRTSNGEHSHLFTEQS
jgi:hypothetical protein